MYRVIRYLVPTVTEAAKKLYRLLVTSTEAAQKPRRIEL
jgi:hypothetical protein